MGTFIAISGETNAVGLCVAAPVLAVAMLPVALLFAHENVQRWRVVAPKQLLEKDEAK
ncbi:MAG: hypothetical protein R2867_42180 [Caldilineaceae bacterium]